MRRLSFWIGTALISVGAVILLIAGGIYAYGLYEDVQYQNAVADATQTALSAPASTLETMPQATAEPPPATAASTQVPVGSSTPEPTGAPTPVYSPLPSTPTAALVGQIDSSPGILVDNPQPATRIKIAAIKLDAPVTESVVSKGLWVVPRFAAGHLQGTANPGGPGNAVYAGHVSSISSGNVFANIGKLVPGDDIVLVTAAGDLTYQVSEKVIVKNDDLSVIRDFGDQRITLITCTGTWLPLVRDFNQRLIIFATRVA